MTATLPQSPKALRVLVVTEYYPRSYDPVLGIWAHRQAVAAQAAGAEVKVVVLHRPVPPQSALVRPSLSKLTAPLRQPSRGKLDGIDIHYVKYLSPPRNLSYRSWGVWAARPLRKTLQQLESDFPFDLVHAHYAVPAADAFLRTGIDKPLVVSVHGGDVLGPLLRSPKAKNAVAVALKAARLVLANSTDTANRCRLLGVDRARVVHLGTDIPAKTADLARPTPTIVTVAHLVERKRHSDVLNALALLKDRHHKLRYLVIGDGPELSRLQQLAVRLGIQERVQFTGQLTQEQALERARNCTLFVLPSLDEAFGVAYIEAMAGGVPAIGCQGEGGPEEIAALGRGLRLVPARSPERLAEEIAALLDDPVALKQLGQDARATAERNFSWERCGTETVLAYREILDGR